MEYAPPYIPGGNPDPNAPYVDRDSPGGIRGSVPPARAIEDPQREIGYVIDKVLGDGTFRSAQDPDDTTQLYQSIIAAAPLITQNLTINVTTSGLPTPADPFAGDPFDKLSSAFAWLRLRRIMGNAIVTIAMAAGTYSESVVELDLSHPDGLSVKIIAADLLAAFPIRANFNGVRAIDEAMLRSKWAVKVECAGDGIVVGRSGLSLMKNIMFIGAGIAGGIYFGTTESFNDDFGGDGPASGSIRSCAFIGFASGILARSSGSASLMDVVVCHCAGIGILANDNSYIRGSNVFSIYNGAEGLFARDGSKVEISGTGHFDANATTGIYANRGEIYMNAATSGSITATANGIRNVFGTEFSGISLGSLNLNIVGGGSVSANVTNGSQIFLFSCINLANLSPADGTVGNNNAYLKVL